jgi:hypothetical protein
VPRVSALCTRAPSPASVRRVPRSTPRHRRDGRRASDTERRGGAVAVASAVGEASSPSRAPASRLGTSRPASRRPSFERPEIAGTRRGALTRQASPLRPARVVDEYPNVLWRQLVAADAVRRLRLATTIGRSRHRWHTGPVRLRLLMRQTTALTRGLRRPQPMPSRPQGIGRRWSCAIARDRLA